MHTYILNYTGCGVWVVQSSKFYSKHRPDKITEKVDVKLWPGSQLITYSDFDILAYL